MVCCCLRPPRWWTWTILLDLVVSVTIFAGTRLLLTALMPRCTYFHPLDPSLSRPHIEKEVFPDWSLGLLVISPILVFLVHHVFSKRRRDCEVLTRSVVGLAGSFFVVSASVSFLKLAVGRQRPDWFSRLRMANVTESEMEDWTLLCDNTDEVVVDGRKGFPSGHAAYSVCIMLYLSLWLMHRSKPPGLAAWLLCLSPLVLAVWCSASRVTDHRHSCTDVVAGIGIGALVGTVGFLSSLKRSSQQQREEQEYSSSVISEQASVETLSGVALMRKRGGASDEEVGRAATVASASLEDNIEFRN